MVNSISWTDYNFSLIASHPPKPGRYLIYRQICDKMHFETWNGNGWASSNTDCSHWAVINKPIKQNMTQQKVYSSSNKSTKKIEVSEKKETKKVDKSLKHESMWEDLKNRFKKEMEK